MSKQSNCENCSNYIYDEEYENYYCDVNLDEDEYARFISNKYESCPYFSLNDEYKIVRKQM